MLCLYNLRQLTLGWTMYANESNGKLTPNHGIFPANRDDVAAAPNWVAGDMDYTGASQTIPGIADATNSALLVDPAHSELGPYVKNPALFHCPADQSQYTGQPRVRSCSMNCAVGSTANGTLVDGTHIAGHWLSTGNAAPPGGNPFMVYLKDSDIKGALSPANLFVLLDEHPDSINDATFAVQMPIKGNPASYVFIDMPAKYHNNAGGFSFADGHVEMHAWQLPADIPNVTYSQYIGTVAAPAFGDPDIAWLASHTSSLVSP
jgi:prepilin-type processing-associated H-X9-DG protein